VLALAADAFLQGRRSQLTDLAARNAVPAIYTDRDYTTIGGLMSYGPNFPALFRRAASFNLVINLRAAKALGLTIPPSLLARADEVME
jgi:putative ABC transport system substrate-binding protein